MTDICYGVVPTGFTVIRSGHREVVRQWPDHNLLVKLDVSSI